MDSRGLKGRERSAFWREKLRVPQALHGLRLGQVWCQGWLCGALVYSISSLSLSLKVLCTQLAGCGGGLRGGRSAGWRGKGRLETTQRNQAGHVIAAMQMRQNNGTFPIFI